MEEEPNSINIGDLDILGLEQDCKKKEYDKIPKRQLENLEVILSRARQQRTLGISLEVNGMAKTFLKKTKKEEGKQIFKEPSALGKCWWNREDITSLQSITISFPIMNHEDHLMEYSRAK